MYPKDASMEDIKNYHTERPLSRGETIQFLYGDKPPYEGCTATACVADGELCQWYYLCPNRKEG
jgi:hypothetical protein